MTARALWDFTARTLEELSFKADDMLQVYPPDRDTPTGWLPASLGPNRGYCEHNLTIALTFFLSLVPKDYVRRVRQPAVTTPLGDGEL